MIKLVVADDHSIVRAGLVRLLESESDMKVVGDAGDGAGTIKLCRALKPDVLILDFDMGDMDGIEITRRLAPELDHLKILILTMHDSEEYAIRLIQAGAGGFMIKGTSPDELPKAVRAVHSGKRYVTPSVMEAMAFRQHQIAPEGPISSLSERELQVLLRLAQGETVKEVSDGLSLSTSTVETYKKRIQDKLELRNLSDLTRFAIRHDLIDKY